MLSQTSRQQRPNMPVTALRKNLHDLLFAEAKRCGSRVRLRKIFLYGRRAQNASWVMRTTVAGFRKVFKDPATFRRYIGGQKTRKFIIRTLKRNGVSLHA